MFLEVNYMNLISTCLYLLFFILSYYAILYSRLEELFKKGDKSVWPIRIAQVLLALAIAYLATGGIMLLVNSTQF